jgi:hypothetical protein
MSRSDRRVNDLKGIIVTTIVQQFQIQNYLSAFQLLSPHPPTPSPRIGRRGAGEEYIVSCSLSQAWERAGVRANQCRISEFGIADDRWRSLPLVI